MSESVHEIVDLSKRAYRIFSDRGARLMSASIAFYALLSVVPILVIALRVAGLFAAGDRLDSSLESELTRWVGAKGAAALGGLVRDSRPRSFGSGTDLVGVAVLVYASTRLFSQVTKALDLLWNTTPLPKPQGLLGRVLAQLQKRTLSFLMVLFVGVSLLITALSHTALAAARHALAIDVSLGLRLAEAGVSFGLTVLLFFLMFRVLPRTRVRNVDALVGSFVTALLFTVGSLVVTAYVSFRDTSLYGAASALVMLMLWTHYNAHAFFLGAAFTAARSRPKEGGP